MSSGGHREPTSTDLALGVDIGGTKILIALVTPAGGVLRQWTMPTAAARGGEAVMASLEAACVEAVASLDGEERGRLRGVGVCAAGQVDWRAGAIAYASPNIPGWAGMRVGERLQAKLALPVCVDNDANSAAYGEWWAGAGRGARDLVMVTVGTGVGGGIVSDGRVLRGGSFRGGEIGHMILVADGVPCNCGQAGCLEVYASGTAIARLARAAVPHWDGHAPDVFAAAEAGDAAMEAVVTQAARSLAQGLVSLASVIDPDRFVLGGGVAMANGYLERVRRALQDPSVSGDRGFDGSKVVLASLGTAAGAVGAAGQFFAGARQ